MVSSSRPALRAHLRAIRERFASSPEVADAALALARHLRTLVAELEPDCLGLYWPTQSEFNVASLWPADKVATSFRLALPFAQREPRQMHYRLWDGTPPTLLDGCSIPASSGEPVVPDVVLAPCVGFTQGGYRLGYGGGYFDRWLAAHPHAIAIGVAWSLARIDEAEFAPQPHDLPLTLVVTEEGVVQDSA
jgi:5,10-methenyltetrahydrofolate synthetase